MVGRFAKGGSRGARYARWRVCALITERTKAHWDPEKTDLRSVVTPFCSDGACEFQQQPSERAHGEMRCPLFFSSFALIRSCSYLHQTVPEVLTFKSRAREPQVIQSEIQYPDRLGADQPHTDENRHGTPVDFIMDDSSHCVFLHVSYSPAGSR